jgi:hypothetical protein
MKEANRAVNNFFANFFDFSPKLGQLIPYCYCFNIFEILIVIAFLHNSNNG